ncbi:MAG: hypothetical protein N2485_00825 [bacterium]|nr:hypothetical protein [bacterium]
MNNLIYSYINYYFLIINFIFGNDRCIKCSKLCINSLCKTCKLNILNKSKYLKIDETNFNHFNRVYFDEVYSVDTYTDLFFLIKEYKFNNKIYLSYFLSHLLNNLIKKYSIDFDLIINIPNHDFLQYTLYLALNLSKIYKKPILNFISILNKKQKQHFIENKDDRIKNVKNKYILKKIIKTNNLNKNKIDILLLDDIIKTGATINEVSKLIKENIKTISKIKVISLAKA